MKRNTFVALDIDVRGDSPPLGTIKIAVPCKAEWKWMYGDERVRFCGQCSLNVFNLSAMTTEEAEDLIRRADGRLCVRFYRRNDGTILTRNCPVGLQAIKDRFTSTRTHVIAAILGFLGYLGLLGTYKLVDHELDRANNTALNYDRPGGNGAAWLKNPDRQQVAIMGAIRPISLPVPSLPTRSESFIRGKAIFKVIPIYHSTGSSRANGNVVVRVVIDEDGAVEEVESIAGHPPLKDLGEEAARQWRFEPILVNGRPARIQSSLTFRFAR
jgi:TonB family protein